MVLAISPMGNTAQFIFYTIGILLLISAAVGLKFVGERAALIGLGLAVIFFIPWWTTLANL
jgi:hypothetical protein